METISIIASALNPDAIKQQEATYNLSINDLSHEIWELLISKNTVFKNIEQDTLPRRHEYGDAHWVEIFTDSWTFELTTIGDSTQRFLCIKHNEKEVIFKNAKPLMNWKCFWVNLGRFWSSIKKKWLSRFWDEDIQKIFSEWVNFERINSIESITNEQWEITKIQLDVDYESKVDDAIDIANVIINIPFDVFHNFLDQKFYEQKPWTHEFKHPLDKKDKESVLGSLKELFEQKEKYSEKEIEEKLEETEGWLGNISKLHVEIEVLKTNETAIHDK